MTNKTLLILAAGMGSRYGGNKQIDAFGPHQEMLMDYSIYDAIQAGFNKIVFIIREDFTTSFKKEIEARWKGKAEFCYMYQSLDKFFDDKKYTTTRTKPWGTAHAILCAKDAIQEPFLMINADDFYGRTSFVTASEFLTTHCTPSQYGLVAYQLNQTVSEHGSVSRGVCEVKNDLLVNIKEHTKIYWKEKNIASDYNNTTIDLDPKSKVSMNFFCFHHTIFTHLEKEFASFLEKNHAELKTEFLISAFCDDCIKRFGIQLKVENTNEKWFGVTYPEDAEIVREEIKKLIASKHYPSQL